MVQCEAGTELRPDYKLRLIISLQSLSASGWDNQTVKCDFRRHPLMSNLSHQAQES